MLARSLRELRTLGEALATVVVTWLLLGWFLVDRPITQGDGSFVVAPYVQSMLDAGIDWTEHLYRVGVLGGSQMHELVGTQPIVQLCTLLGLETTTTLNVITIFLQLCFAFFGAQAASALCGRRLVLGERITAVWVFGFAPLIAWRLALGHENLLFGTLPLFVTIALLCAARARTLGLTSLVFAIFAIANGVSGFGAQTVLYGAVFGAPIVIVIVLDAPRGERWTRAHWLVAAALACGVLSMLPRMVCMFEHAVSADATRGLGESVRDSFNATGWRDWLTSLLWTAKPSLEWHGGTVHEYNYALGPWLLLPLLSLRGRAKRLPIAFGVVLVVAILFAQGFEPVPTILSTLAPPLDAFRVPARAVLAIGVLLPLIGLSALWSRVEPTCEPRRQLAIVLAGAVTIFLLRFVPEAARDVLAWLVAAGLVVVAYRRATLLPKLAPALTVLAAIGAVQFGSRFPRHVPYDPIEDGPRALHTAAVAAAPELADPLNRIQLLHTVPPYDMSTAVAAQLGSLDGFWFPPKRFLMLLGALSNKSLPPTTVVFTLAGNKSFPVLQQLYNVRYVISVREASVQALPEPAGAAWFPAELVAIDKPEDMTRAFTGTDLRPLVRRTAWVLRDDFAAPPVTAACSASVVRSARSDRQRVIVEVATTATCPLVVATNYTTTLRATARVGGVLRETPTFPIDIALTGVIVPDGATQIIVAPTVRIPWWSRLAQLVGIALVIAALVAARRELRAA